MWGIKIACLINLQVGMMREEILEAICHNISRNLVIVDKAECQIIYLRIVFLEKSLKFCCLHLRYWIPLYITRIYTSLAFRVQTYEKNRNKCPFCCIFDKKWENEGLKALPAAFLGEYLPPSTSYRNRKGMPSNMAYLNLKPSKLC